MKIYQTNDPARIQAFLDSRRKLFIEDALRLVKHLLRPEDRPIDQAEEKLCLQDITFVYTANEGDINHLECFFRGRSDQGPSSKINLQQGKWMTERHTSTVPNNLMNDVVHIACPYAGSILLPDTPMHGIRVGFLAGKML